MKPLLYLAAALLAGCATQPTNLVLKQIDTSAASSPVQIAPVSVSISSQDLRTETYLGRVRQQGEPALLLSPGNNPRQLMEQALSNGLTQLGYQVSAQANTQMALQLDKLQVDVEQNTLDHQGNSVAAVTVTLSQAQRELVKRFAAKGKFTGVMAANAGQMELELNNRVQQLITAVLTDPEIHQFIQQGSQ
ncbi:YajG family lipoprotein [uncultured Ferrimonas sp.]|uniref:YajG family lipoprotein n=1 Tax=uncultured Ferrimonas sp. TaxID=432640 RepID=UPI00262D724B|nr:YajG family lipoprotein [uncultured Ferrimonas sp.]